MLRVRDLTVAYHTQGVWREAVRDVALQIDPGQTYGLVGESGSGKTTVVLAVLRYLSANARITHGSIELAGRDISRVGGAEMREVWGKELALVPQDPLSSLNPSIRVGEQLAETLRHHRELGRHNAAARAVELLDMVHLGDPERVAASYPHQISGGMQQRVMIAMALSTEPRLLVLDEPTTSLDVTTQAVVLDLLRELIRGRHTGVLYVTHNLGVVAGICDRVGVLYAGELVEDASTVELYGRPLHPYTRGLLDSVPRLGDNKSLTQLRTIEGHIPAPGARPTGCVFSPRCPLAIDRCRERPTAATPNPKRAVRCHRWNEILAGQVTARFPAAAPALASNVAPGDGATLSIRDVRVRFLSTRSVGDIVAGRPRRVVRAVDGVGLDIYPNRTIGLVGESGSGKTTLSRAIVGLVERERGAGSMDLLSQPLPPLLSRRTRKTLRHLQMVFQNPEEALNPHLTVGEILHRPLRILLGLSRAQANAEVGELLTAVSLPPEYALRRSGQLSGGEKQRVAIARAFAARPDLLICDEPVSSLDVSVQASILNLLARLQVEHENSLLFISHDMAVVGYLADTIAVIYLGRLMELAPAEGLFAPPYHPYTEALLSAIPLIDPGAEQKPIRLQGEIPGPWELVTGCPFHSRCPRVLGTICADEPPPWQEDESGKQIFCHIPLTELRASQERPFTFSEIGDHHD